MYRKFKTHSLSYHVHAFCFIIEEKYIDLDWKREIGRETGYKYDGQQCKCMS